MRRLSILNFTPMLQTATSAVEVAKFFFAGAICTYRKSRPFIGPLFIERDPVIEETIALSNQFRNAFGTYYSAA